MPVPPSETPPPGDQEMPLDQEETSSLEPPVSPPETPAAEERVVPPAPEVPPSPEVSPPTTTPPPLPPTEPETLPEAPSPPPEPSEVVRFEEESKMPSLKKIILPILALLFLIGIGVVVVRFVLPLIRKPAEVTLTYWGLWEPESVMNGVIADWERDHPKIKISYSRQSPKEYRERLQSALARDEGPDIFRFHNTWVPMLKNELDPVPATVMDAASFEAAFYPVARSDLRSGANYLGIPLEIDTLALFYNEDIFQAAGKTPPTTWEDLRNLASALTVRDETGNIRTAGVALGTTANIEHWSDILGLMMVQNGATLSSPTGDLAEDALTYFTLFSKVDKVWNETLPSSMLAFSTGKLAMYFGFSWDVFEIKNTNPDLSFKVVSVPQLPGTNVAWASYWVEGVAKKSEYTQEAWEFLKYLSSQEVMQKLYQAESQVRLFGEPYSRVDMANLIKTDPMAAPFVNQAQTAQSWYLASRTFDNGINDRMIKYFEGAVNAVNAGDTSEEALSTAGSGVSQLLSQYGLGSYTVR